MSSMPLKHLDNLSVLDLQDILAWLEAGLGQSVSEFADARPDPDLAIYYQGVVQRYVKDIRAITALIKQQESK